AEDAVAVGVARVVRLLRGRLVGVGGARLRRRARGCRERRGGERAGEHDEAAQQLDHLQAYRQRADPPQAASLAALALTVRVMVVPAAGPPRVLHLSLVVGGALRDAAGERLGRVEDL